ncbi:MAG: Ger(x)C family spore germination protein [Peptococcaceae bacterium]
MKRMLFFFLTFLLAVFSTTGCWDTMDISNRAFVTAIGVDQGAGPKKFKVSLEIVKPVKLLTQDAEDDATIVETVEADSIALALEEIQGRVPRLLSLGHLRVMLIGERLARENFRHTIEFIQKHPEKALRLRLIFVKGREALEVLKAKPAVEKYMAGELITMTMMEERHAMIRTNPLIDLIGNLRSTGGKGLGGMVTVSRSGEKLIHNGSAVFDKWKLIGWLDGEETRAVNWIVGNANTTVLVTSGDGAYAYRIDHSKVSVKPTWNSEGRLEFVIRLKTDGMMIDEQETDYDLKKPREINEMEKIFSQEITGQIQRAVHKSQQELGVDYLGLGQVLRRHAPREFNKLDWEKVYPDIPVKVLVNASVTRFGLSP